eukprot:CAMPEP_0184435576 /NCGR_PEP_ID=MMETSP0738-20130409/500004_1 /TAXON_ID=385413 /ORGANISM="Thalassiosira miniscula, Strain CCMP1093" /LENGTH=54 /DNA_ID=CAMNT_0026802037 /DNA_START=291 /DNA_END=455 /DNA_ORIENTATION=-
MSLALKYLPPHDVPGIDMEDAFLFSSTQPLSDADEMGHRPKWKHFSEQKNSCHD